MTLLARFAEVLETLQRHPFRTALTAFSVAWGVFMLVVLLGVGKGLQNAVAWQFRDDATNSLWVYRGRTSVPYAGYRAGRTVPLELADHDAVAEEIAGVEHITSRYYPPRDSVVAYKGRTGPYDIRSVHPDHRFLERTIMTRGRYINPRDLDERRKVAVIGEAVMKELFLGADPIGQWLEVGGVPFEVVGVFEDMGDPGEEQMVYLPITTAQSLYRGRDEVRQIMFTVGEADAAEAAIMEADVRQLLAERHQFAPGDRSAVRVRNNVKRFEQFQSIFSMLQSFLWLAGIGTVLAGVVGVSNIMLVSVAERTSEIGLRKALGAIPADIVTTIVGEAVLLTSVAGYAGLVGGVGVVEAIRQLAPENDYVRDPEVDLLVVGASVVLLVLAGAIAGFVPARRAARIHPVEALRDR
jgi:putative ABC transport system permease protein